MRVKEGYTGFGSDMYTMLRSSRQLGIVGSNCHTHPLAEFLAYGTAMFDNECKSSVFGYVRCVSTLLFYGHEEVFQDMEGDIKVSVLYLHFDSKRSMDAFDALAVTKREMEVVNNYISSN